jgi:N-acetylmuramoyl-L-alanine amidase
VKYNYRLFLNTALIIFIIFVLDVFSNNTTLNPIINKNFDINNYSANYQNIKNYNLLSLNNSEDSASYNKVKFPSLKNKYIYTPKKTNDSLDSTEMTPPDFYKLPPDLYRKEIDKKIIDSTKKNDTNINNDFIFQSDNEFSYHFANLKNEASNIIKITKITAKQIGNNTEICFVSNEPISSYQKPELNNNLIIFRIPNVKNMVDNFKSIQGIGSVSNIKFEKLKNILIYKIFTKSKVIDYTINRKNKNELVLKLISPKKNIPKVNDEAIAKNEPKDTTTVKDNPTLKKQKNKWSLDVIVLDPGHGGQDYGAISINGYNEKDLVLDIA